MISAEPTKRNHVLRVDCEKNHRGLILKSRIRKTFHQIVFGQRCFRRELSFLWSYKRSTLYPFWNVFKYSSKKIFYVHLFFYILIADLYQNEVLVSNLIHTCLTKNFVFFYLPFYIIWRNLNKVLQGLCTATLFTRAKFLYRIAVHKPYRNAKM